MGKIEYKRFPYAHNLTMVLVYCCSYISIGKGTVIILGIFYCILSFTLFVIIENQAIFGVNIFSL